MGAFGFGAGRAARRRPIVAGPPVAGPSVAPGYLATVSTAPYAAYGAQRVMPTYTGPLFQLRRASDAAVLDVSPQSGGDYPDYAAITAWAGASALTVTTLYDQSGNARHLTQAAVANQPSFDPAQVTGGVAPVLFDGYGRGGGALFPAVVKFLVGTGWAVDQAAHTVMWSADPQNSFNASGFVQFTNAGGGTNYYNIAATGGAFGAVTGAPAAGPHVMGYGASATQLRLYEGERFGEGATTKATLAMPRFVLGTGNTIATTGVFALHGLVVYPAYLSVAEAQTVATGLTTAFAQGGTPAYRVVLGGDSIQEGAGSKLLLNTTHLLRRQLSRVAETYTPAVSGQTAAQVFTSRVAQFGNFYTAARPCIAFVQAGINDVIAGTAGATLYSTSLTNLVAYLKGLGYRVVVCTLLPFTANASWTSAREAQRLAYNDAVRANAAGADHVLDLAANPVMGDAAATTADTALWVDGLHPTTPGYRWLAGAASGTYAGQHSYYHVLREVLRGVTGDANYVP
jgi:lysophospholipase L1-like esterase